MKRFTSIGFTLGALLSFVACSGQTEGDSSGDESTEGEGEDDASSDSDLDSDGEENPSMTPPGSDDDEPDSTDDPNTDAPGDDPGPDDSGDGEPDDETPDDGDPGDDEPSDVPPESVGHVPESCGAFFANPTPDSGPIDCTSGGDEQASCVFSNHCYCSVGFVCEGSGLPSECTEGEICVPE